MHLIEKKSLIKAEKIGNNRFLKKSSIIAKKSNFKFIIEIVVI